MASAQPAAPALPAEPTKNSPLNLTVDGRNGHSRTANLPAWHIPVGGALLAKPAGNLRHMDKIQSPDWISAPIKRFHPNRDSSSPLARDRSCIGGYLGCFASAGNSTGLLSAQARLTITPQETDSRETDESKASQTEERRLRHRSYIDFHLYCGNSVVSARRHYIVATRRLLQGVHDVAKDQACRTEIQRSGAGIALNTTGQKTGQTPAPDRRCRLVDSQCEVSRRCAARAHLRKP